MKTTGRSLIWVLAVLIALAALGGTYLYTSTGFRVARLVSDPRAGDLLLVEGRNRQFVVGKISAVDDESVHIDLGRTVYPDYNAALVDMRNAAGNDEYFSEETMTMPRARYTRDNILYVERASP